VRRWILVLACVAGCVDAAGDEPRPQVTLDGHDARAIAARAEGIEAAPAAPDVCALAAALPPENICSLMCDPDAIEARMIDEGKAQGVCYEFLCALPGVSVSVGVCLPPPPQ
jgi:hypothetical protein